MQIYMIFKLFMVRFVVFVCDVAYFCDCLLLLIHKYEMFVNFSSYIDKNIKTVVFLFLFLWKSKTYYTIYAFGVLDFNVGLCWDHWNGTLLMFYQGR